MPINKTYSLEQIIKAVNSVHKIGNFTLVFYN